jgi:hypothetical protein
MAKIHKLVWRVCLFELLPCPTMNSYRHVYNVMMRIKQWNEYNMHWRIL